MDYPMMQCGHQANAVQTLEDGTKIPSCVICAGVHPGSSTPMEIQPDLSGRRARCTYFGTIPKGRNHSSNYGCKRGEVCDCEVSSAESHLAFFEMKSHEPFDSFYCGCWGWD